MLGGWEADLLNDAARRFECGNSIAHGALHASLHTGDEVLLRQGESLATNGGCRGVAAREVQ